MIARQRSKVDEMLQDGLKSRFSEEILSDRFSASCQQLPTMVNAKLASQEDIFHLSPKAAASSPIESYYHESL